MSRRLKRRIHVIERLTSRGFELDQHYYERTNPSGQAKRDLERHPHGRRKAVYDRDESMVHPGPCLWVIERHNPDGWLCIGVVSTVDDRDRVVALAGGPTRVLRFVRRKERGW